MGARAEGKFKNCTNPFLPYLPLGADLIKQR